jgi:hypothetical protein
VLGTSALHMTVHPLPVKTAGIEPSPPFSPEPEVTNQMVAVSPKALPRRAYVIASLAIMTLPAVSGCAQLSRDSHDRIAASAVVGAVAGGIVGGGLVGAAIGAGVGAAAGAARALSGLTLLGTINPNEDNPNGASGQRYRVFPGDEILNTNNN